MTWDAGLLLTGLPLCLATRAANIFPLSRVANKYRKLPLPLNLQVRRRCCRGGDHFPCVSGCIKLWLSA